MSLGRTTASCRAHPPETGSDHIADLGETISRSWILGRTTSLPVYGGPSVERVIDGFNLVYSPDELYRIAHHVLVSGVLDPGLALDTACALERIGDERNSAIMRDIRTYHISVDELGPLA